MNVVTQFFSGRSRLLIGQLLGSMFLLGIGLAVLIWFVNSVMGILGGEDLVAAASMVTNNIVYVVIAFSLLILFGDSLLISIQEFYFMKYRSGHVSFVFKEQGALKKSKLSLFFYVYGRRILFVFLGLLVFSGLFWLFGLSQSVLSLDLGSVEPDVLLFPFLFWLVFLSFILWVCSGISRFVMRRRRFWFYAIGLFVLLVFGLFCFISLHVFLFNLGWAWWSLVALLLGLVWFVLIRSFYLYVSFDGIHNTVQT